MKSNIFLLFFALFIFSCENDTQLAFEPITYTNDCENCPKVTIDIPDFVTKNKLANAINTALREELIAQLSYDDSLSVSTIPLAIESFNSGYNDLLKRYPEESTLWEAEINAKISYEDERVVSLIIHSFIFTGGAHGYSSAQFLNFDKRNGKELENWELFEDPEHFKNFAESKFRIQENIAQDESINSTGFMFENEVFHFSEQMGFTNEGLVLLYNQYEIASYADGTIEMIIPMNEIKNYLVFKSEK